MALTEGQIRAAIKRNLRKIANRREGIKKLRAWTTKRRRQLGRLLAGDVPSAPGGWHPKAQRVPYADVGPLSTSMPARLVWHTTEGSSLPRYNGSAPHITFDVKTGRIYQHIPLGRTALALKHPPVVETNRANAIQVELIAFSDADAAARAGRPDLAVKSFTDADYARIASLARWIEKNAGVKRACTVKFENRAHPLSPTSWLRYAGHLGHQHVPGNDHWDPSGSFRIDLVLE